MHAILTALLAKNNFERQRGYLRHHISGVKCVSKECLVVEIQISHNKVI